MSWNALTEAERESIVATLPGGIDGFLKGWGWLQFAQALEDKCREKNEPPDREEVEFEVWAGDEFCASASGPREAALKQARAYAVEYLDEHRVVRIEEVRSVRVTIQSFQYVLRHESK